MTFILKCNDCGRIVEYVQQYPNDSMYGAAYMAGFQHEKEGAGQNCSTNGARQLVLIGVKWDVPS